MSKRLSLCFSCFPNKGDCFSHIIDKFPLYKQNTWMKIKRRWCRNHESIVSSPVEISDTFPSKFSFIWLQKLRFLFIWRKFFQVVFWRISFAITGSKIARSTKPLFLSAQFLSITYSWILFQFEKRMFDLTWLLKGIWWCFVLQSV